MTNIQIIRHTKISSSMHRLPGALPTDPNVKDYLIRFLGSNPFYRIKNQTGDNPFSA